MVRRLVTVTDHKKVSRHISIAVATPRHASSSKGTSRGLSAQNSARP